MRADLPHTEKTEKPVDMSDRTLQRILNELTLIRKTAQQLVPQPLSAPDWSVSAAWHYRRDGQRQTLEAVTAARVVAFDGLQHIAQQKAAVQANTQQFMGGRPANNVLLTGSRGTGKSSLIRACLHAFAGSGLRMIEIGRDDLADLPAIARLTEQEQAYRFILYCDDMDFATGEAQYRALKSVLDGSLRGTDGNLLVYASSNHRHLMPAFHADNLGREYTDSGEIHPDETVEEKTALSERFGLWLRFYPFSQAEYLHIVRFWLVQFGLGEQADGLEAQALQWALQRGSRSGRVARQFAVDAAGRLL